MPSALRSLAAVARHERSARRFLLAQLQSSLGTGAGYVALLVLAYDRLGIAWAVSLVLLADFLPSMLLGPVAGALADRLPRRALMVGADLLRAAAFLGLALADGFPAMLALALLAGVGTALYTPAANSALPSLVGDDERRAAVTSGMTTTVTLGWTAGPALAGLVIAVASAPAALAFNALTFAVSAVLLLGVRLRPAEPEPEREAPAEASGGLLVGLRAGARDLRGVPGAGALLVTAASAMGLLAAMNVCEPVFVTGELGGSGAAFGLFVAVFGLGSVAGCALGAQRVARTSCVTRYTLGLGLVGGGLVALAVAPTVPVAIAVAALVGVGEGTVGTYEKLLVQETVPERLLGRAFGLLDTATAWAQGLCFLATGAVIALVGVRPVLAGAGIAIVAAAVVLAPRLRVAPRAVPVSPLASPSRQAIAA